MGGEDPSLAAFARVYAALDDEALAALANRGLVRRARKDLEKAAPKVIAASEAAIELDVEDCRVKLAIAAAQSVCSCASGVCRHVLAAILHVQAMPVAATAADGHAAAALPPVVAPAADEDLLKLDDETIQRWAGKVTWRDGMKIASRGCEYESGATITIRLPSLNITCRWVPGSGLDGMLCSCHAPGACNHKVAAILAYQAERGGRAIAVEAATLDQSKGAPRTRAEVCESVIDLLAGIVTLGLSQLSPATQQRLKTLAVSAHGVDLPRLQRMLSALGDEVGLALARDSRFVSRDLLATAARIHALCAALEKPTPRLVGQHRSAYDKLAGDIELIGMGARQWRTRSGYAGLTVYFWDRRNSVWSTWSESRPVTQPDFNPLQRYDQDGPWVGCDTPRRASQGTWRVSGAWRNQTGRLSGRSSTGAVSAGPADRAAGPWATKWTDVAAQANRAFAGGFTDRNEGDDLVLLRPAAWTPAQFDGVRQCLVMGMADAELRWLPLNLAQTPETDSAITMLQSINVSTITGVLGQIRLSPDGLCIEPIALHLTDRTLNLTLDEKSALKRPASPAQPAPSAEPREEEEVIDVDELDEPEAAAAVGNAVGTLLGSIQSELTSLVEAGLASHPTTESLADAAAHCRSIGLELCAAQLREVIEHCEYARKSIGSERIAAARRLLEAAYVVNLAAEQAMVCSVLAVYQ